MSFWIITLNCVLIYAAIFPFNNISNDFFIDKYEFNLKVASRLTSTIFIIAAFSCAGFGLIADKIGYRITMIEFSSCLLFLSHLFFLCTPSCNQCYTGLIPLIMIGLSYSIYASALWPMIPIVISEKYLGTAFGITLAMQNAGLGFGPNIVGLLENSSRGFNAVLAFFIIVSSIGIMTGIVLYYINKKLHNGLLQKPSEDIAKIGSRA